MIVRLFGIPPRAVKLYDSDIYQINETIYDTMRKLIKTKPF